jgi:hypothetical protein
VAGAGNRPLHLQRLASTGKNFGAGNPLWRRRGDRRRRVGAVVDAVWMRCVPALFLLFTLVAATILAMSAEVGRPPTAWEKHVAPADCRQRAAASNRGPCHRDLGAARGRGCGGAEIGSGRAGREEGAEGSRAQTGPSSTGRVRVATETLISTGRTRILGSALNFFLPFPSFECSNRRHFFNNNP